MTEADKVYQEARMNLAISLWIFRYPQWLGDEDYIGQRWNDKGDTEKEMLNKADQILNLKGDDWKIAIIDATGKIPDTLQIKTKVGRELVKILLVEANFKYVIWEGK